MNYWLFKSEPGCYSWQDLEAAPGQTTSWDGVRNYQARNFMKAMKKGDLGFFYHSGADPSIVGVVEVVREAYPDHTAQDPENNHFDPRATPGKAHLGDGGRAPAQGPACPEPQGTVRACGPGRYGAHAPGQPSLRSAGERRSL